MSKKKWTQAQRYAIDARGGTVLVSAAAGSGKTAVLVERVLACLFDKDNPCDIDQILVVTFTKAAAGEMRERIGARLEKMLLDEPEDPKILRQLQLLERSNIGTIHSFCQSLLRENFYSLKISPKFRVAEDNEIAALKTAALDNVLDRLYVAGDSKFLQLVENFADARNDAKLAENIMAVWEFSRGHAFPERWMDETSEFYCQTKPMEKNVFVKMLLKITKRHTNYCKRLAAEALSLMAGDDKLQKAYKKAFESDFEQLKTVEEALQADAWENVAEAVNNFHFMAMGRAQGYADDPVKLKISAFRQQVKDIFSDLKKFFCINKDQFYDDSRRQKELILTLFQTVVQFDNEFKYQKKKIGVVDFSDLEHLAVNLLVNLDSAGLERTETAVELSKKFRHIMVDEYQDTNAAQDLIFRAVSCDEQNIFMVGDVKQSIYRFRQASPELFLNRKKTYKPYSHSGPSYPAKIILGKNFRSKPGVLSAINFVFSHIMSEALGDVEYGEEELLVFGGKRDASETATHSGDLFNMTKNVEKSSGEVATEIVVLDTNDDEKMNVAEARYIAKRIKNMVDENFKVQGASGPRPAKFGDFCVLLRSANAHAQDFVKHLVSCGVPAFCESSAQFLDTHEISITRSLLKAVCDPYDEIALVATLKGPLFDFSLDELLKIRQSGTNLPFIECVKNHSLVDTHCEKFLRTLNELQMVAQNTAPSEFLMHIYDELHLPEMSLAMPGGKLRHENLLRLLEYAKEHEERKIGARLHGFVEFLDTLEDENLDLKAAAASPPVGVVHVMSIHRSKGLEFPVCFIANCSRKFNKEVDEFLLHPHLGVGLRLRDETGLWQFNTTQRAAICEDLERAAMSEELRILYVAMTRAREKLIMLCALKSPEKRIESLAKKLINSGQIDSYTVQKSQSFTDWLLLCGLLHPDGKELRRLCGVALPKIDFAKFEEPLDIKIVKAAENSDLEFEKLGLNPDEKSELLLEEIAMDLAQRQQKSSPYPRFHTTVSVSDLISEENGPKFAVPSFAQKARPSQNKIGIAMHAFMQFVSLETPPGNLQKEIKRLARNKILTNEETGLLNLEWIQNFFTSNLAARMRLAPEILREKPFVIPILAGKIHENLPEYLRSEPVFVRGTIDCAFKENDGWVIADYKTSSTKISSKSMQKYRRQLIFYKQAFEFTHKALVKQCVLYQFSDGKEIFF